MSNELKNPAPDGARSNTRERDYEVGYKKPPKATQFKKGQSGNPKGRSKGKSIPTLLEKVLYQPVELRHGGRQKLVPAVQALLMATLKDGIHGSVKSTELILKLAER